VRCTTCSNGVPVPVRRARLIERDGRTALVYDVPVYECPSCAEITMDLNVAKRLDEIAAGLLAGEGETRTQHYTERPNRLAV
jgi:YgiT-type zinc finger domain-containing protein